MLRNIIEEYNGLIPPIAGISIVFLVVHLMYSAGMQPVPILLLSSPFSIVIIYYWVLGAIAHKYAWIMNALAMCKKNCIAVELIDFEKTHSYSMAYQQKNGEIFCYVYPIQKIGLLKLAEDGTVSDINGDEDYVEKWLPLNKVDRMAHILRNY